MDSHLMIPGPVAVPYSIRQHMSRPLVPHYGKEWCAAYDEVRQKLKKVLLTKNEVFMQVSSGHGALEAALNGAARSGEEVLVINNGHFGGRLNEIAESLGIKTIVLNYEWGTAPDLNEIEDLLKQKSSLRAVICVHSETSTGVLNPVAEIGKLLESHGSVFIVDAISSAGATELRPDEWGIDFCVLATQKGLESPAGLSIISISDKGWAAVEREDSKPTGYYCNPLIWKKFDQHREHQPYFVTMPTNTVMALGESLDHILEETLEKRWARHSSIAGVFRQAIRNMGLELFSAEGTYSDTVTALKLPAGLSSLALVDFMDKSYNIKISAGLGAFKQETARVGHMGAGATLTSIIPVLFAMEDFLRKSGLNITPGASLKDISA